MKVPITQARKSFAALIRAAEDGETAVITRRGKPVAQITPPAMRDRIKLFPGWDDPIDFDRFLAGGM